MRKGAMNRCTSPKMAIRIEYQDDDYTYISSEYGWKDLKKDIETIKVPIQITWNSASTAQC